MSGHLFGSEGLRENIKAQVEWALASPEKRASMDAIRMYTEWRSERNEARLLTDPYVAATEDGWLGVQAP